MIILLVDEFVQALADSWFSGDSENKFAEANILVICLKNIVGHSYGHFMSAAQPDKVRLY